MRITNLEEWKAETQEIKVLAYNSHFEELKTLVKQHSLAYSSLHIRSILISLPSKDHF